MQDDIRDAIDQLNTAFLEAETDGVISDDERSELRALVGSLDNLLAAPESHEGVVEQVEGFALAFQERHPGIARIARGVVDTLSGYGI